MRIRLNETATSAVHEFASDGETLQFDCSRTASYRAERRAFLHDEQHDSFPAYRLPIDSANVVDSLSSLRKKRLTARPLRRRWSKISMTSPSWSIARHRYCRCRCMVTNSRVARGNHTPATGSPEAVTHLRLPQNAACRFPARRSSEVDSQHRTSLELPIRERQLRAR